MDMQLLSSESQVYLPSCGFLHVTSSSFKRIQTKFFLPSRHAGPRWFVITSADWTWASVPEFLICPQTPNHLLRSKRKGGKKLDFKLSHTSKGREGREARKCKWRHSVDGGDAGGDDGETGCRGWGVRWECTWKQDKETKRRRPIVCVRVCFVCAFERWGCWWQAFARQQIPPKNKSLNKLPENTSPLALH